LKWRFKRMAGLVAIAVMGMAVVAALLVRSLPSGWTWDMVTWRAQLFARKAEGRVPDLSWRELWFMTRVHGGFGLQGFIEQGFSLDGALENSFSTPGDRQIGARIFGGRCAVCHGKDGTGGFAVALNHSGLKHGDSDLAIYKVVRDGIPQTPMAPVVMSSQERWQLVSYLKTLSAANSSRKEDQLPIADINVSSEQIRNAGSEPDQWLTYSGSLDGHRYTPLAEINPENVSRLQVRWVHQFGTNESARAEATPIVVGGVVFLTEPPATVVALDAKSGALMWRYTRNLPDRLPICCSRTNRGLAILGNVLYLGSLDCALVALDAVTGNVLWETSVCKSSAGFSMTGAPLVVNQSVVVGVAGGEYGVRGFLAAYDAKTGKQEWKFDTVPGPGELGHETWKNDAWKSGGAPTWITGSYDPSLDLLYWGVGNPSPGFLGDVRPGDNLFTDSVLALHASTGKLAWYFQFTPHDQHDWDAVQTPVLADVPVKGLLRRVMCVANRNGFYYVLDRTTGEFLVGVPFVSEDWAKGLDTAGRPILTSNADVTTTGRLTKPGVSGGVNWQNTAFDQKSGLFFVNATEGAAVFTKSPEAKRGDLGFYPGSAGGADEQPEPVVRALDAATGEKKWEHFLPPWKKSLGFGYSGLLATGGHLVFGASGGFVFAVDSTTGRELWRVYLGGDTYAPPISFTVAGHQVVLVSAGSALFMFGL